MHMVSYVLVCIRVYVLLLLGVCVVCFVVVGCVCGIVYYGRVRWVFVWCHVVVGCVCVWYCVLWTYALGVCLVLCCC